MKWASERWIKPLAQNGIGMAIEIALDEYLNWQFDDSK
jgi:hypothetical protein